MRTALYASPRICALLAAVACGLLPVAARANNLVDASLLAEPSAATPGSPFTAAIRLRVPDGWHVSWRNPGDAGLTPTLRWRLPDGVSAGAIQWPVPSASVLGPVTSYVLDGEVWLLVELVPARALFSALANPAAAHALALAVDAEWLVCKQECIPEKSHLALALPLADKLAPPGLDAAGFLAARARLPRALGWTASLGKQDLQARSIELRVTTGALPLANATAQFFPYEQDALEPSAPQRLEVEHDGLSLFLARPRTAKAALQQLSGVLVVQGNDARDRVAAELSTAPPLLETTTGVPLWLALICAFAGGILLNLMPCVLPVLGFKVLTLVRDASVGKRRARVGGLAYSAGVIASFWALAALLHALRASGRVLGWGFQLQSPAVVSLLALLFFALGLSFLGFAPIGYSVQSQAGALRFRSNAWGAFASGVLATAVATPCTAPFMGVALGAAIVSPPLTAWAIFTALGVGMAWPYALLSFWPALLQRVPRPGPWMERLQQALAFPLFATVLWLLAVLSAQAGPQRVTAALAAMLLCGFALWIWRNAGAPDAPEQQRSIAGTAAILLVGLGAWGAAAPSALIGDRPAGAQEAGPAGEAGAPQERAAQAGDAELRVAWADWSEARYAQLRAEGHPVFVDFTAAWCISCQVNERVIFSSREVRARFAALGVVPLRADWTRSDPAITRALESFGRSGVPLNLIAGPGTSPPIVLPALLTRGMVMDALDQIAPPR